MPFPWKSLHSEQAKSQLAGDDCHKTFNVTILDDVSCLVHWTYGFDLQALTSQCIAY
jgi:hypothetical protein